MIAAASGAVLHARSDVLETVHGLVRTMHQLHADRERSIDVHVDPRHQFRGRREDLAEVIGNLLDNACKWARMRVSITSSVAAGRVLVTIEDDGPGLDAEASQLVLQRGVRRDERGPGSGLGLAIVRELAELYGGAITLARAAGGGVSACIELPGKYAESPGHTANPGV